MWCLAIVIRIVRVIAQGMRSTRNAISHSLSKLFMQDVFTCSTSQGVNCQTQSLKNSCHCSIGEFSQAYMTGGKSQAADIAAPTIRCWNCLGAAVQAIPARFFGVVLFSLVFQD